MRLSELLADVPLTYVTPELRVDCPDELKFDLVARVLEHYRATHTVVDVDGARIQFEDGWGLVRASNTQPVLVMRFEANSEARRDALRAEVEATVKALRDAMAPAGVTVEQGGVAQQQGDAFASMGIAMLIAIALVYLVMVVSFGSLTTPFARGRRPVTAQRAVRRA